MRRASYPRWALSLADLTLLLLGFTVMLHVAMERQGVTLAKTAPVKAAAAVGPALFAEPAAPLFADGEARLTPYARGRLNEIGRQAAARPGLVRVESRGTAGAGARFDRWELTAARTAAVARALAEGGLPQDRIDLVIPALSHKAGDPPQRIVVRHV